MTKPKLLLKGDNHNKTVHFECNNCTWCYYAIEGVLSEDGFVHTFNDDPKKIDLTEDSIVGDIDSIDLEFLIEFMILTVEKDETFVYQYTSSKFWNVELVGYKTYEVPLNDYYRINNEDINQMLKRHVDEDEFPSNMYDIPLALSRFLKHFHKAKFFL